MILVCFAVRDEARAFKAPQGVKVLLTGMGQKNAESEVRKHLTPDVSLVTSAGFAGGLDPQISPETIVFSTEDKHLRSAGGKFVQGAFATVDRIYITASEKAALFAKTRAAAVDMESDALAAVCKEGGIPFCVLKIISDAAGENMPLDFNQFLTANMEMNLPRLIGHVLQNPRKIPRLLEFQKRVGACNRKLAEALYEFIATVGKWPPAS